MGFVKNQYLKDSEIREEEFGEEDDIPTYVTYPGQRPYMPKTLRYKFNKRLAAELALMSRAGINGGGMIISLSGKEIPNNPNLFQDDDLTMTNMQYVVFKSNVISPNTHRMNHEMMLTEDVFQINCDFLRPRRWIRVRSWNELVAMANGSIPPRGGVDVRTIRWLVKNTQISRELFTVCELNIGMRVHFTVDWERYLRIRNAQNPERIYRLRTPKIELMEIIRESMRNAAAAVLPQNRAFLMQHSYARKTSSWRRRDPRFIKRKYNAMEELAKLDNPRMYPMDFSDYDENYRNVVLNPKRTFLKASKNTWQGGKQNGAVPEEKGQDED